MYNSCDFRVGTRIRVLKHKGYRKLSLVGMIGTVRSNYYGGNIGVELDHMRNDASSYGYFYFNPKEMTIVSEADIKEDNNMPNITNYLNIAKIQYLDNDIPSRWDYANFDPGLEVGDLCVVMSAHLGMGLAKVVEIVDQNDVETQREIVAKVDTWAYDDRVKCRKQAAELKAKMQERAKQLQDIALYQMLAKDDPDMMALLQEYQALPKM